jgi:hypothetical protein
MYKSSGLPGGHIVMLGPGNEEAGNDFVLKTTKKNNAESIFFFCYRSTGSPQGLPRGHAGKLFSKVQKYYISSDFI